MQVDEREFFREATLRICGSLDVETFLYKSFKYIRQFIPADSIILTHYRAERGEHVALAQASAEGASLLHLAVPVPPDIRSFVMRPDREALVVERAETHPTARPWISKGLLEKDSSLLVLRLIVDGDIVGGVTFISTESDAFNQQHAHLSSLLREPFAVALSNSLRYQELLELKELLVEDNRFLHSELRHIVGEEIVGADFGLRGVMEMVRQVAPLPSPVLLWGETGTGKEVIAGAIHSLSGRKDGPFITVNCGAIPENLVDSELFGHEKGAFTGALARKRGRFERANGGTIFLDEVGELQPEVQVRLLRVLQEKEIERVGGTEPIKVDIRVIAATHRNLRALIGEGSFREDLYFRLNVFPIEIPPLRERKGDISSLVHYFMQKKAREMGRKDIPVLAPGALERLMLYPWPGNVRELENMVERSLILSAGKPLTFEDIETPMNQRAAIEVPRVPPLENGDTLGLDAVVSRHIRRVLKTAKGRIGGKGGAADLLQINPSTLRKRMRKLDIPFGRKRNKG
ncbi:MAG: sigma-54-dependent Fis family transcriptional regulator [Desulfatiglandaceae bacterium]|jgi:transcriptional regulator with GAF, ATPase, and Fis domain